VKKAADLLPRFLRRTGGVPPAQPAVVGVSGGVDSVVLFDLLRRAGFARLFVAHFHHGLRGREADRDAAFVRKLAKDADAVFAPGRGQARTRATQNKESLEQAARELRRRFLARAAKKHGAATVFLAHHANDAAETMLFHLARGTGRRGLGSLRTEAPLENSTAIIMRPLLGFTREEILDYARSRKLAWREDRSNRSRAFTRNRLRRDVLPALARAVGHDPVPPMARAADILAAEEEWLESLVTTEAQSAQLDVRSLRHQPVARQRRLLRAWLAARTEGAIDFDTVEAARALALGYDKLSKLNLPRTHHLRRRGGKLFVERPRRTK
jgi:tRNA(Ile)-lysidine synthase